MKRLSLAVVVGLVSVFFTVPAAPAAMVFPCDIRVKTAAYGEHGWKFSARLIRNGDGYAKKPVHLDLALFGDYVDIGPTKRTNDRGRAVWTTRSDLPANDFVLRFRFDGNRKTLNCTSNDFTLPRR